MSQTYDERIAKLAVTSRIIEEVEIGLKDNNRTLKDIHDDEFKKIIAVSTGKNIGLGAAILAGGLSYAGVATAMGTSLGVLGIAGAASGILGLVGLPLLGPIAIIGYFYKKKKEREVRERQERDLLQGKVALQKIIKKQVELINELKKAMEELKRRQTEVEHNVKNTMNYAKQQEDRVEYLERLLNMVNMASGAYEAAI